MANAKLNKTLYFLSMNSDNFTVFINPSIHYSIELHTVTNVLGSVFLFAGLFHWHNLSVEALCSGRSSSPLAIKLSIAKSNAAM